MCSYLRDTALAPSRPSWAEYPCRRWGGVVVWPLQNTRPICDTVLCDLPARLRDALTARSAACRDGYCLSLPWRAAIDSNFKLIALF
jgi:hypothetical protein